MTHIKPVHIIPVEISVFERVLGHSLYSSDVPDTPTDIANNVNQMPSSQMIRPSNGMPTAAVSTRRVKLELSDRYFIS